MVSILAFDQSGGAPFSISRPTYWQKFLSKDEIMP